MPRAIARRLSKQEVLSQLRKARVQTDELFSLVRSEALYERPIEERHRIVFYLGHLEAFDWNMICKGAFGMKSFNDILFRPCRSGFVNRRPFTAVIRHGPTGRNGMLPWSIKPSTMSSDFCKRRSRVNPTKSDR